MKEKYSVANVYRSMCYLCMRNKGVFYDMMEKWGKSPFVYLLSFFVHFDKCRNI